MNQPHRQVNIPISEDVGDAATTQMKPWSDHNRVGVERVGRYFPQRREDTFEPLTGVTPAPVELPVRV